jgi:hypothetical protein
VSRRIGKDDGSLVAVGKDDGSMTAVGKDDGSVTAEIAVGLTAVVIVLSSLVSAISLGQAQLRAVDAAAAGARAAARGETEGQVLGLARRLAGTGAQVTVSEQGGMVGVEVRTAVPLPLPGSPTVTVKGSASTPAEAHVGGA